MTNAGKLEHIVDSMIDTTGTHIRATLFKLENEIYGFLAGKTAKILVHCADISNLADQIQASVDYEDVQWGAFASLLRIQVGKIVRCLENRESEDAHAHEAPDH